MLNGFDMQSAPQSTKQGIARLWFEKSFLTSTGDERPQILILGWS